MIFLENNWEQNLVEACRTRRPVYKDYGWAINQEARRVSSRVKKLYELIAKGEAVVVNAVKEEEVLT